MANAQPATASTTGLGPITAQSPWRATVAVPLFGSNPDSSTTFVTSAAVRPLPWSTRTTCTGPLRSRPSSDLTPSTPGAADAISASFSIRPAPGLTAFANVRALSIHACDPRDTVASTPAGRSGPLGGFLDWQPRTWSPSATIHFMI